MKRCTVIVMVWIGCGLLVFLSGCGKKLDPRAELPVSKAPKEIVKDKFDPKNKGYTNLWLQWSKEMIVGGYERTGRKNSRWDDSALSALEEYASLRVTGRPSDPENADFLREQLKRAINAGCDDPLIRYLNTRMFVQPPAYAKPETVGEYSDLATQMDASGYDPLLKFYVNLRAAEAWRVAFEKQAPEVNRFRRAAMNYLQTVLSGEEIPAHAAFEACRDLYEVIDRNEQQRTDFYQYAEPLLLGRWGKEAFPYFLKGRFYIDYAWEARGGGWAKEVDEDMWKLFADRLSIAEEALDKAWKMDRTLPDTPLAALKLELGQGRGRERMEMWYQRAIAFPQDRYNAVYQKLWYLQPRWYGSEEECLDFARSVVKSDQFTGQEPLQLYHTHESLAAFFKEQRPGYWTEPQVWPDIKASFERYFELNGEDNSWRHNYVMCAWRCQQWQTLNEQIAKLTQVNYEYFGGQEEFEKMVQAAKEQVQKPK